MKKVTVIGAGHWGIALATVLADNGNLVKVCARRDEEAQLINKHNSSYFENITLNENITATSNLDEAMSFSDHILVSIPIVAIIDTLKDYINTSKTFIFSSKGLYNGKSMSMLFEEINPESKVTILSGPSFSDEVMEHKYTAVCIASKQENLAIEVAQLFNSNYFRVYTSTDVVGVEYCGAIKNVFAIVCGMLDGANMGSNTKNAIITRGLSELNRIITFVGGSSHTLHGLAGIGDIMLTCNSFTSRNYSFGHNYIRGIETKGKTVEGLNTIKEIYKIAKDNNIEMPIINSLYNILFLNSSLKEEALHLMNRDMKSE